jgi:peroxiredoxin Q/BCP
LRDDYELFTDLGAEILAIAPESMSAADKFLGSNPMPYPLLVDDRHTVFDAYDVVSTMMSLGQRPALFVVDAEGVVRFDMIGTQQWQTAPNAEVLSVLQSL